MGSELEGWPRQLGEATSRAILRAAAAVLGSDGDGERHTRALRAIASYLLGVDGELPALGIEPPADLADHIDGDELRDHVMAILVLCVLIDGTIDERRLAVVDRIGAQLHVTPEVIADLARIAARRVLGARICIVRRISRDLFHRSLWSTFGSIFGSALSADDELVARYRALEQLPDGSFGRALFAFYEDNLFRFPGERGLMAPELTAVHDARHVLAGWDGGPSGEVGLAAFESGASRRPQLDWVVAVLLHLHVGVEILESFIPARHAPVDLSVMVGEIARGSRVAPHVMDARWDFWPLTPRPLDEVRALLGIEPGGSVRDGVSWSGAAGHRAPALPLDKVVLGPETDRACVALAIRGQMSAEDITAIDDLLARRAWNARKTDLLLELGDDSGYADGAAFLADLGLAVRHRNAFRRIAIVGSRRWHQLFVALDRPFARLFGVDERVFAPSERDAAVAFVRAG